MPTYQVTDPTTGKKLRLTGESPPTEQELEQIFSSVQPKQPEQIQQPEISQQETQQPEISTAGNIASGLNEGIARTLGLPVDAVSSAINQAVVNFGGQPPINDPVGGAKFFENVLNNLGLIGKEPTTPGGRITRRAAQEVGAAALPGLGMASAPARTAGPIGAFAQMAQKAPAAALATETGLAAAGGAAAGTVKEAGGGPLAQLAAQVATPLAISGTVAGVQALARGATRGGEAGRKTVEETINTFKGAGAMPSVGQATQRRALQNLETISSKGPGGGTPFFRKATETVQGIQKRINSIADDLSKGATVERAGRTIKQSIGNFVDDFKGKAGILYNKLDDAIPKETKVTVSNTKTLLDDLAAPVAGAERTTTELVNPIIRRMQQNITEDAADGTLPYGALKALRTRIGEKLTSNDLITDVPRAQLKRLYGAISEDLKAAAQDAGALQTWRRADDYWKAGINRVDDFLEPLAKKVQPEDIFIAATKGREGATRIRAVMRSLNPKEKETVAAAVLKRLGKANPSAQDELSDVFSTETFLTNWAKLDPNARSALFSGSKKLSQYAKNIDQIAKTARIIREGSRALYNPSGTASQSANIGTAILATGGIVNPSYLALAATAFVSNNALARLMTSPKFVKFLADSTRFPAHRLPSLMTRLTVETQNENAQLQQDIQEYFKNIEQAKQK